MVITKREHATKQGFCKILWRKLRLRESLLLVLIQFFGGWKGKWGGVVVEFLSLSGSQVGLRWAPIRINTVRIFLVSFSRHLGKQSLHFIEPSLRDKHSIKTRNIWSDQYSWNYISAKTVTYMQHINSHLTLNVHQNLILNSVLLILIFRSCEIYYRTLWKGTIETFLFKEGFKKSYLSFMYRFNLLFHCNILYMFYYQ